VINTPITHHKNTHAHTSRRLGGVSGAMEQRAHAHLRYFFFFGRALSRRFSVVGRGLFWVSVVHR